MQLGLCTHPGCFVGAIKAARSAAYCRTHYRSLVLTAAAGQLVTARVLAGTGAMDEVGAVADAVTGDDVTYGGTVTLDPAETNIVALVQGGIVEIIPSPAAEVLKAKAKD